MMKSQKLSNFKHSKTQKTNYSNHLKIFIVKFYESKLFSAKWKFFIATHPKNYIKFALIWCTDWNILTIIITFMEKNENKVCSSSPSTPPPPSIFFHCWFFTPYSITISNGKLLTAFCGIFFMRMVYEGVVLCQSVRLSVLLPFYTSYPSNLPFVCPPVLLLI